MNLLDNAIKYTPSGGRIDVAVVAQNNRAVIEVADNGIGIPPELRSLVFDRFYRVDKARSREMGGAGLGLSIVRAICKAHGGGVHVRARHGTGTTFVVELPLARECQDSQL